MNFNLGKLRSTFFLVLALGSLITSCVSQPVEPSGDRYTHTVINENKIEPFADSACVDRTEFGITRVSIRHEAGSAIFICSDSPLRQLGPTRFVAEPGQSFAIAVKTDTETKFPIAQEPGKDEAHIVDLGQGTGLNVLYPVAREREGTELVAYKGLYGKKLNCSDKGCEFTPKATCLIKPEEQDKVRKLIEGQPENSSLKAMNLARLAAAKEEGCFE